MRFKEWWNNNKWYGVGLFLGLSVVFGVISIYPHISDTCEKELSQTGFLAGWVDSDHINFNGNSWYVSEWWTANNYDSGNISKYFGHTVKISYYSGCGRCLVTDISILV